MSSQRDLRDAGMLYNPGVDAGDLAEERIKAKDLCFSYNNEIKPSNVAGQQAILKQLFGKMGSNVYVCGPIWVDYGYNIEVGDNFFANHNFVVLDTAKVKIGNNVFIATNVNLTTAGHPIDVERRNTGLEYAYPITIGDNVWIGSNVCILPGVTIGSNVVIGAGSVVTRDIPDNVVAFGNPCKVFREVNEADKQKYLTPPKCMQ